MPKAKQVSGMQPLPRYVMPDESEPEYNIILDDLYNHRHSLIGSSYFYIKSDKDDCALCRIIHGGGKIYFHEVVDHARHGISDEDLELSVKSDTGVFSLPGHHPISPHVEQKLRVIYDI
jgi:hypothetical protein